jgi:predicted nucleic acid-binding protein
LTRVFLDANVIIAAAKASGGESRVITRLGGYREDITLLATPYTLDEAERTLQREATYALAEFYALRQDMEVHLEPSIKLLAEIKAILPRKKQLPKKDLPILAGAISAGADLLLTHDGGHFGPLYDNKVKGVEILRPIVGLRRIDPNP